MPNFSSTSSSSDFISGRKYLFGGIGVFILILVVTLTVYLFTSSGEEESFILDNTPLFAGRNNLARNLQIFVKDNLTMINLNSDLTNDTTFGVENCPNCNTDFVRLRKGKVGSQFWVANGGCDNSTQIINIITQLDIINRMIKNYTDYLQIVKTWNDLEDANDNKKLGSLLFVDGGPLIDGSTAFLRLFYDSGVRSMTIGSGCNSMNVTDLIENNRTLTDFGMICINEMNRLGMMIDIQGLSSSVQQEILNISRAPVLISHTAAQYLNNHTENVDNNTLLALKANNGLLMLTFDKSYINSDQNANVTLSDLVGQLNFITGLIGFDNIATGGNYDSLDGKPHGLEDVSDFPSLFTALKAEKNSLWTVENLEKLAFLNFKRFFRDVEKAKLK